MENENSNFDLTICMITYNHEPFIAQAIEGIMMQNTSFFYQLVIGEDCSTDKTREICIEYQKKYPDKIRLILQEKNKGIHNNFFDVLKMSTSKYIALCEGDDYWIDPYKLQKQVDFLESNPEYAICFHNVNILKDDKLVDDFITKKVPETTTINDLCEGNYIHTPSCVFRNHFINKEIPKILLSTSLIDYTLHILNAQFGKIKKLKDCMAVYRIHPKGVHSNIPTTKKILNTINALDQLILFFFSNKNIKKRLEHSRLSRLRELKELFINTILYIDYGNGFSSKDTIKLENIDISEQPITVIFKINSNKYINSLRWELVNKACLLEILEISYINIESKIINYDISQIKSNGLQKKDNIICFNKYNPQVFLNINDKIVSLNIKFLITINQNINVNIYDYIIAKVNSLLHMKNFPRSCYGKRN